VRRHGVSRSASHRHDSPDGSNALVMSTTPAAAQACRRQYGRTQVPGVDAGYLGDGQMFAVVRCTDNVDDLGEPGKVRGIRRPGPASDRDTRVA